MDPDAMNDSPPPDATLNGKYTLPADSPCVIVRTALLVTSDTKYPGDTHGILDGMHTPLTAVKRASHGGETTETHWLSNRVYP